MLALLIALLAQSPPQTTATIRLQTAIVSTEEGRRAEARLRAEWQPKETALVKRESDIALELQKLEKESRIKHGIWPFRHTMSAKKKATLQRAIDIEDTAVRRERDDDRATLEKDQIRAVNDIAVKMRPLIDSYAKEKGYSAVLETPSPDGNAISGGNDITSEVVTKYDQTYLAAPR